MLCVPFFLKFEHFEVIAALLQLEDLVFGKIRIPLWNAFVEWTILIIAYLTLGVSKGLVCDESPPVNKSALHLTHKTTEIASKDKYSFAESTHHLHFPSTLIWRSIDCSPLNCFRHLYYASRFITLVDSFSVYTEIKYLDVIKIKTPNPVPPAQRAAQDLEGDV